MYMLKYYNIDIYMYEVLLLCYPSLSQIIAHKGEPSTAASMNLYNFQIHYKYVFLHLLLNGAFTNHQRNLCLQQTETIQKPTTVHNAENGWPHGSQTQLIHPKQNSCTQNQGSLQMKEQSQRASEKTRTTIMVSCLLYMTRSYIHDIVSQTSTKTTLNWHANYIVRKIFKKSSPQTCKYWLQQEGELVFSRDKHPDRLCNSKWSTINIYL